MPSASEVRFAFVGDDSKLQKTFDDVGAGARDMAKDIDKASGDSRAGFDRLGEGVDGAEGKFRGFGDTISGTSDIMAGFKDGNLVGVAMGFADLAGGLSDFVLPAFTAVRGFIMTSLVPALTAIATHPVFLAIAAGGAIILGLILLEKKFGVVSGAVDAFKDALANIWPAVKGGLNTVIGGLETAANAMLDAFTAPFTLLNKIPGVKNVVPDIPDVRLPRLHSGGVVPGFAGQDVLAVLQAGETVNPRGSSATAGGLTVIVQGSVITERDLGRIIADQLRNNRLIGVTI